MFTRYTCIYTIYTPNTPPNTLYTPPIYTPYIHPLYTMYRYVCVGTAGIINDGDQGVAPHVWVMTRESTSKVCVGCTRLY